jgi:hypothetical protein
MGHPTNRGIKGLTHEEKDPPRHRSRRSNRYLLAYDGADQGLGRIRMTRQAAARLRTHQRAQDRIVDERCRNLSRIRIEIHHPAAKRDRFREI